MEVRLKHTFVLSTESASASIRSGITNTKTKDAYIISLCKVNWCCICTLKEETVD